MANPPNIIFITIDALRANHCSGLGYDRDTTPRLDAFADSAVEFNECISISSHTREAMPPLLSGYRPPKFAANGFKAVEEPMLAERLSTAGYTTGGFHSNPYLSRAYNFDRGFDQFYDDLLLGRSRFFALAQQALEKFVFKRGEYYARADEINKRSLDWLDSTRTDRPIFLWNHYMDTHGPYHAPERHWAEKSLSASEAESLYRRAWKDSDAISNREQQLLLDSYDDEIRWFDKQISAFLDELRNINLLEDSLVIITADHGDAFGEHGYFAHPRYLHEALLHVPLIVSPPSMNVDTFETPVSTLDIVPTILEYADGNLTEIEGTSLRDESDLTVKHHYGTVFASATGEKEDTGIRRFAARGSRLKGTLTRDIASGDVLDEQLFDLETDPNEREPLTERTAEQEEILQDLREFSSRRLEAVDGNTATGQPDEATSEINERLEALGYK